ncbi:hypothetical protein SNEBB_006903 [Seison nebaliae]|nr:hypothetical protein SNEBB_006903 [Seison nebaliae]
MKLYFQQFKEITSNIGPVNDIELNTKNNNYDNDVRRRSIAISTNYKFAIKVPRSIMIRDLKRKIRPYFATDLVDNKVSSDDAFGASSSSTSPKAKQEMANRKDLVLQTSDGIDLVDEWNLNLIRLRSFDIIRCIIREQQLPLLNLYLGYSNKYLEIFDDSTENLQRSKRELTNLEKQYEEVMLERFGKEKFDEFNEKYYKAKTKLSLNSTIGEVRMKISRILGLPLSIFYITATDIQQKHLSPSQTTSKIFPTEIDEEQMENVNGRKSNINRNRKNRRIILFDIHSLHYYGLSRGATLHVDLLQGWNELISSTIHNQLNNVQKHLSTDDLVRQYQLKCLLYISAHYGYIDIARFTIQYGALADQAVGEHPCKQWVQHKSKPIITTLSINNNRENRNIDKIHTNVRRSAKERSLKREIVNIFKSFQPLSPSRSPILKAKDGFKKLLLSSDSRLSNYAQSRDKAELSFLEKEQAKNKLTGLMRKLSETQTISVDKGMKFHRSSMLTRKIKIEDVENVLNNNSSDNSGSLKGNKEKTLTKSALHRIHENEIQEEFLRNFQMMKMRTAAHEAVSCGQLNIIRYFVNENPCIMMLKDMNGLSLWRYALRNVHDRNSPLYERQQDVTLFLLGKVFIPHKLGNITVSLNILNRIRIWKDNAQINVIRKLGQSVSSLKRHPFSSFGLLGYRPLIDGFDEVPEKRSTTNSSNNLPSIWETDCKERFQLNVRSLRKDQPTNEQMPQDPEKYFQLLTKLSKLKSEGNILGGDSKRRNNRDKNQDEILHLTVEYHQRLKSEDFLEIKNKWKNMIRRLIEYENRKKQRRNRSTSTNDDKKSESEKSIGKKNNGKISLRRKELPSKHHSVVKAIRMAQSIIIDNNEMTIGQINEEETENILNEMNNQLDDVRLSYLKKFQIKNYLLTNRIQKNYLHNSSSISFNIKK